MRRALAAAVAAVCLGVPASASAVTLVVPANDQRVSATPELGWQLDPGETSVRVAVYRRQGQPASAVFSADLAPDQISIEVQPPLARGRYYWLVQGSLNGAPTFSPEGTFVVSPRNPCIPANPALLCPDLAMSRPSDLRVDRLGFRRILRSTSSLNNVGSGPIELRGTRISRLSMRARQRIRRRSGGRFVVHEQGIRLGFKFIPGQGRYWKMRDPARLRIVSLETGRTVRLSPKLYYCLRDLRRTRRLGRSPRRRVYPGCSQRGDIRRVTLGTSVGWSDIYPASYYEQWVDVTGLRGRYRLEHTADPLDLLYEESEENNSSSVIVSLPSGRRVG